MAGGSGGSARTAAPRGGYGVGTAVPRGGSYGAAYGRYGGYGYGRYGYGGFGFSLGAPYYAFSPRFGLGFGLYVGYPVSYPYWAFPDPYVYGYPYPPAYGSNYYPGAYPSGAYPSGAYPSGAYPSGAYPSGTADPNSVTAVPGPGVNQQAQAPVQGQATQGQYGGLSFQITPATAQIHVDGVYVGTVGQFAPTTQPLTLTSGQHHVELRADGYQAMTFDVNVAPGQVIPYQGTMQSQAAQGGGSR
jgi:hypothetical protein